MLILGLFCQGSGVLEGSEPVFSETRAQLLHKKIRVSKTVMENMKADSGPQEVTAPSTSCPGRDGSSASKVRPGTEFNSSWLCHLRGLERNSAALSPPWQRQQSRFSMIANTFPFKTVPKDTTSQYNPRSRYSLWRDHRLAQGNSKGLSVLPENTTWRAIEPKD